MTNKTTRPTSLFGFLRHLIPNIQSQQERDELYLADAVDIYDLERRMREIDCRGRHTQGGMPLGLGLR